MRIVPALAIALAPTSFAAEVAINVYIPAPEGAVMDMRSPVDQPENPLNCDEVWFTRAEVWAIIQNDNNPDPDRSAALRALARTHFQYAVVQASGAIHEAWLDGTLYGVEFDWFMLNGTNPPTTQCLPYVANIWHSDEQGADELAGRMYCYDADQYEAREAAVEASVGHDMREFPVWSEYMTSCIVPSGTRYNLTGKQNELYGWCTTASGLKVQGSENVLWDLLRYVTTVRVAGENSVLWTEQVLGTSYPSMEIDVSSARDQAKAAGTYYPGNLLIRAIDAPPAGLIFAEGDITVEDPELTGTWTLVSATGTVTLAGARANITAHTGDVAAVAFDGDVMISASDSVLFGEIHAPRGMIDVAGSSNVLHGIFIAERLSVTGDLNTLSDGTHPQPAPGA